jgi:2C-methyl-D-erythritol 2,4-cyclodiphosphate synthase
MKLGRSEDGIMNKIIVVALFLALTVSSRGAAPLPSGAELKKLTDQTLLSFNSAVQKADFTDFYKSTAELWQKQTTPDKLKEIFKSFIDRKFDMEGVIKKRVPTFDPAPAMDADGFMVVNGAYNVEGDSLTFKLHYLNEGGAWKVVGINVHFQNAPEKRREVPSETELKKLTDETLLSFNSAVQSQDFGTFYKSTAKLWQEQTTPEKLKAAFKTFIDQKFDIAPVVQNVKPAFEPSPAINSDGLLVVQGSYPIKPDKLAFALEYLNEDGAWKLASINVKANKAAKDGDDDGE